MKQKDIAMNRSMPWKLAALVAMLSLGAASWAEAQNPATQPENRTLPGQQDQTRPGQDRYNQNQRDQNRVQSAQTGQPQKINKASNLIGMEVKNQTGEQLGTIKDVVLDVKTGRVAYCVLATDKGVLQAEKMHAIPLYVFQPSADGQSLTLKADKTKLTQAQGFSQNDWPSVSNPSWGAEPFWQDEPGLDQRNQIPGQNRPGLNLPGQDPNRPGQQPPSTTPRTQPQP
jgi:sporulation protein YlmC with PRC-barrel domain